LHTLIVFVYDRIAEDRTFRETLRFLISEGSRSPYLLDRHYDEFMQPVVYRFRELIEAGIAAFINADVDLLMNRLSTSTARQA
jgi:hypothetical protein